MGEKKPKPFRAMPGGAIWVGGLMLLLVGGIAVWLLLWNFGSGTAEARTKLEAIRVAASIVVGTGGAAALLLAARKQRSTELELEQKAQGAADTKAHQDRVAAANEHDAIERRVTELYGQAIELLGHDEAPVRLGALYALARLAHDNPTQRQTIVNVLCAYLRMPAPAASPGSAQSEADTPATSPARPDAEEQQVRLTAQRILLEHLRPQLNGGGEPTNEGFWPEISLDLTGATLHDWDFKQCHVHDAGFDGARFHGITGFRGARFHGNAQFVDARFYRKVRFDRAQFHGESGFSGAWFHGEVRFDGAQFHDHAWFSGAWFHGPSRFVGVWFHSQAWFPRAQFCGWVQFHRARARLDLTEYQKFGCRWPASWTVRELGALEGHEGNWGELVRKDNRQKAPESVDNSRA